MSDKISNRHSVSTNWSHALEDKKVTQAELNNIIDAAKHGGVSRKEHREAEAILLDAFGESVAATSRHIGSAARYTLASSDEVMAHSDMVLGDGRGGERARYDAARARREEAYRASEEAYADSKIADGNYDMARVLEKRLEYAYRLDTFRQELSRPVYFPFITSMDASDACWALRYLDASQGKEAINQAVNELVDDKGGQYLRSLFAEGSDRTVQQAASLFADRLEPETARRLWGVLEPDQRARLFEGLGAYQKAHMRDTAGWNAE